MPSESPNEAPNGFDVPSHLVYENLTDMTGDEAKLFLAICCLRCGWPFRSNPLRSEVAVLAGLTDEAMGAAAVKLSALGLLAADGDRYAISVWSYE